MLADLEKPDLERIIRWLETDDEKAWGHYAGMAEQVALDVSKKMKPLYRDYKQPTRSIESPLYDPDHKQACAMMPHLERLVRAMRNQIREAALESARAAIDWMKWPTCYFPNFLRLCLYRS